MTAPQAPRQLAISKIVRDPRFQMRKQLDRRMVSRYATVYLTSGHAMPPLEVALVEGRYLLVDGFHRLAALELNDARKAVVKITKTTHRDALWMAGQANLKHGLPLKATELRKAFKAYVNARQHIKETIADDVIYRSYREMAAELGGTRRHTTIHNWMREDFPKIARAIGERFSKTGNGDAESPGGSYMGPEEDALLTAFDMLRDLRDLAATIQSPRYRGELIDTMQAALSMIERAGPWLPPSDGL